MQVEFFNDYSSGHGACRTSNGAGRHRRTLIREPYQVCAASTADIKMNTPLPWFEDDSPALWPSGTRPTPAFGARRESFQIEKQPDERTWQWVAGKAAEGVVHLPGRGPYFIQTAIDSGS